MKWVLCLLVFAALSGSAYGQDGASTTARPNSIQDEQAKAEVDRLLNTTAVRDRAWAAYYIGRYRLADYVPQLVEMLKAAPDDVQDQYGFLYRAALDSLIQLRATVPADDLSPIYKKFPDEVMILLAANPKENQAALLDIAREADPSERNRQYWLAACNLLVESEARGFAAHLLDELTISLTIYVTDQAGMGFGDGQGFSIGCGAGMMVSLDGFPPLAFYGLTDDARRGSVVLAPGPRTIYYERVVQDQPRIDPFLSRSHNSWRKNDFALEYLAALLKIRVEVLQLAAYSSHTIHWKDRADFLLMVRLKRDSVESRYNELKDVLQKADLLSADESRALPFKITMRIVDERKNKSSRLPEIPGEVKSQ